MSTLVFICAPFKGDIARNIEKAKKYARHVLEQGYIPVTPHLLTGFLNDDMPYERKTGLKIAREVLLRCDELWVFGGEITEGMKAEIDLWKQMKRNHPLHYIKTV